MKIALLLVGRLLAVADRQNRPTAVRGQDPAGAAAGVTCRAFTPGASVLLRVVSSLSTPCDAFPLLPFCRLTLLLLSLLLHLPLSLAAPVIVATLLDFAAAHDQLVFLQGCEGTQMADRFTELRRL